MKRSCLILSILCISASAGFSTPLAVPAYPANVVGAHSALLPSHLTLDRLDELLHQANTSVYHITLNTVLPLNEYVGIELVKISGDLLSVISPVTESGAFTTPTIAAEKNFSTAMVGCEEFNAGRPGKNHAQNIPIREIASPSAFVIRVVK